MIPTQSIGMNQRTPPSGGLESRTGISNDYVWPALLLGWWFTYLVSVTQVSVIEDSLMAAGAAAESGSPYTQLLVLAFALLGVAGYMFSRRSLPAISLTLPVFGISTYLLWCYLTLFWSESPTLSIRRLSAFVLVLIGAYGVGTSYYGRLHRGLEKLGHHVVFIGFIAACALLILRVGTSSLEELMSPEWSLKGNTTVSYFGYHFGYAIVAATVVSMRKKTRMFALGVLILFLLLLKGRTLIISTLCSVALAQYLLAPRKGLERLAWGLVLTGCCIALVDLSTGGLLMMTAADASADLLQDWLPYLTLGVGEDNITSLSGREPLWHELLRILPNSLWTGQGFGAFWTPERLQQIYAVTGWPAVNAHNGFLDEMLATGIIGLALAVAFLVKWFRIASEYCRFEKREGVLMISWIVLFLCFNTMDSIFQMLHSQFPALLLFTSIYALSEQWKRRCDGSQLDRTITS